MTRTTLTKMVVGMLFLQSIILLSCKHDPEITDIINPPSDTTNNTNTGCSADTVYFAQQILPLFQSGCAMSGCHDAASHEEDIVLDSYSAIVMTGGINIANPTSSKIYRQMVKTDEERMPPPPAPAFTSAQLALIAKWIGQGAKNNSCIESGCDTTNVAYSTHIKPLIQNNCQGCHSGTNAGGGIQLVTYADAKAIADNGQFKGVIEHLSGYSPMPQNGAKLTDCQISMVNIWLNNGALDN